MIFINLIFLIGFVIDQKPANDTITISPWYYLGPFTIGVREGIIGVDLNLENEFFEPDTTMPYPSILTKGGFVKWNKVSSENDKVAIRYDDVLWDTIQDYYGVAGILCATIAYGEFVCNKKMRVLIDAQDVGSFVLNGKSYPGDVYGDGYVQIPVVLSNGKNRVVLKLTGYGEHEFSFKILPTEEPIMIVSRDILLPDFVSGEVYDGYLAVPILNATEEVMANIRIEINGESIEKREVIIPEHMPFSVMKMPIPLRSKDVVLQRDSILIKISVNHRDFAVKDSCWIKVKNPDEPFVKTFISKMDNSCQYYAVLPPKNYNPKSTYALIMTCHGAGVEARGQVGAYSQKDWAFVVAPTNRRRFGFDWQDWGRLDFFEVLEDVKKNFKIDTNRIYLTGHSMGGHGVWHIGLFHPDLFAAIAPSAGWTSFQLYIPWFLQKSELFAEPDQLKFRDMVLREDVTPLYLENALNLPIYILHGSADDNVPPIQGRMMAQYLKELGYDFVYNEIEGKGHWWDIDSTPGVDCVDLKEMVDFLKDKRRNPYPESIVFKTSDIGHSNKAYWIRIDELEDIYHDGKVSATFDSTGWSEMFIGGWCKFIQYNIRTENIRVFTILLKRFKFVPDYVYYISFNINGARIECRYNNHDEIAFAKSKNGFKVIIYDKRGLKKTANLCGPIKQAYFSPFILIYGTIGDSIDTENNLHQARLQSYTWWIRANGYVQIVADTEITEEHIRDYNLILFGNSMTNAIIKKINKKMPINFKSDYESVKDAIKDIGPYEACISFKDKVLKQKDLCLMEIYPNPLNPDKFVLLYSATTKKAQKYIGLFPVIYSGSGLPDFIIWDDSAARYGWAGVVAAGFFNKNWQIDKSLIYFNE